MVTVRNFTSELLLNSGQQYCNCRGFFSPLKQLHCFNVYQLLFMDLEKLPIILKRNIFVLVFIHWGFHGFYCLACKHCLVMSTRRFAGYYHFLQYIVKEFSCRGLVKTRQSF